MKAIALAAVVGLLFTVEAERSPVHASLASSLDALSTTQATVSVGGTTIVGAGVQLGNVLAPQVESLAVRGIDFPIPPTAPGFVYSYDPQLQTFTRSKSLGPSFSERPDTVGQGRFDVGMSFLFGDLDSVDGGGFGASEAAFGDRIVNVNGQDTFLA